MLATLAENYQSHLHAKNINSFYTAELGAQIAHFAFQEYIRNLNLTIAENVPWSDLKLVDNYVDLFSLTIIGLPPDSRETTLHLNLNCDNDYFFTYSSSPIVNELDKNSKVQTSVSSSPLGEAILENGLEGEFLT